MSDSLRDQLLKAGFNEPKTKPKPARKPSGNAGRKTGRRPEAKAVADRPAPSASGKAARENTGSENPGSQTTDRAGSTQSNAPLAGYTHVKAIPAKKKKKQKAPAIKPRASSWGTRDHAASASEATTSRDPARTQLHKQNKEKIQKLIERTAVKDYKGEEIYRFTIKNKIRELLVSDAVRKQLSDSTMAITRLNGGLFIIPAEAAITIRDINPQWMIFMASDAPDSSDDDEEFPVPDDLVW